jgi:WD40 repeat protein
MFASRARIIILTFLLLPTALAEGAQLPEPKADGQKAKTDLYGDPLPPGAIARCGTMRLRHSNPLMGVIECAFAPDGKTFATRDLDTLRLWDTKTSKLIWELPEMQDPPVRIAWESKHIAMLGKDQSVCIVDATTGKLLRRIPSQGGHFNLSPDGKLVAIANKDGEVKLWDLAKGTQLLSLASPIREYDRSAFSSDSKSFVTFSANGSVCYWDVATGKLVRQLDNFLPKKKGHTWLVSQDGRLVAIMPWDNSPIKLLDTNSGKQRCAIPQEEKISRLPSYFTRDGRTLLTNNRSRNGEDTVVSFWDTESGKLQRCLTIQEGNAANTLLSPDGRTLATHKGGIVCFWDATTGKRIFEAGHQAPISALVFTRNGRRLVSAASFDKTIRVWNAATGEQERSWDSHKWSVICLNLSPDGKTILSGGWDGTVRLHELATGKQLWRFVAGRAPEESDMFRVLIPQVGMSPDGQRATAFSFDARDDSLSVHILDTANGTVLHQRPVEFTTFRQARFSPDSKYILGTREPLAGPRAKVNDPQVFEKQRDKCVALLQDVATGREVFSVGLPDFNAHYHRFTPDDRMIVTITRQLSASEEYRTTKTTLRVWELANGMERLTIDLPVEGNPFNIISVAVSENCRTLATSRGDGIIHLWDLASGKELLRRKGYASQAQALAFAPDGKRLASGHRDGTILIWDLSPQIDRRPSPPKADAKQVEQSWTALAGDDAKQAHAAIWGLVAAPERTLPLFRERLHPAEVPPAEKLKQLISDLDSEEFGKRNAANKELAEIEELAEPAMREALKEDISAEKRKRLEKLLDITLIVRTPGRLRQLRALEVLEQIGTPEARQLLAKLSKGVLEARLTRDAKAALQRLERR